MKKGLAYVQLFLLLLSVGTATSVKAQDNVVSVSAISLEVDSGVDSMFSKPLTKIKLKLNLDKEILSIRKQGTELISFSDDQGADLLKEGIKWRRSQPYITSCTENGIGVDNSKVNGGEVTFPISVTATPTKGAKTISLRANVVLHCYPPEKSIKINSGPLDLPGGVGEVVFSDEYSAKFYKFATGHYGGEPELTFIKFDTDALIEKISFLDVKEQKLKTIDYPNPNLEIGIESSILPSISKVSIEYTSPVVITVPVTLTTGLGIMFLVSTLHSQAEEGTTEGETFSWCYNKGVEYYKQGKYDQAEQEFKQAIELKPNDIYALYGLGNTYYCKAKYDDAVKIYTRAININPDYAKVHYSLSLAYSKLGMTREAEKQKTLFRKLSQKETVPAQQRR